MDDLLNLIANVGFPIAVAAYLLIRIENKLSDLTRAISELRECIITLPGRGYVESSRGAYTPGDNPIATQNPACPPA